LAGGAQLRQVLFRHREIDEQRADAVDDGEGDVVGLDRRPREYQPGADDTSDWRADRGVGKLQARDFRRRLAGTQVGRRRRFAGADVVDLFLGDEIAFLERCIACRVSAFWRSRPRRGRQ
jgi:hypothetical protein